MTSFEFIFSNSRSIKEYGTLEPEACTEQMQYVRAQFS